MICFDDVRRSFRLTFSKDEQQFTYQAIEDRHEMRGNLERQGGSVYNTQSVNTVLSVSHVSIVPLTSLFLESTQPPRSLLIIAAVPMGCQLDR